MDRLATFEEYQPASLLERRLAVACLLVLVALNIGLVAWKIAGVPVRGLLVIGLLGAVLLLYPERLEQAARRFAAVLWLAFGLAVLGTAVSIVNGVELNAILASLSEVHVQIPITLLVAAVLADIAGMKSSATAIAAVVGISVLVALLQFLGIEAAWDLREALDGLQDYLTPLDKGFEDGRPMGMALTKIQFATHACLAFAVYAAMREQTRSIDSERPTADILVLVALGALVAASIISATRSPLLGAAAFVLIYALRRPGSWLILVIVLGGVFVALSGSLLIEALEATQPRILRTDDNSATGRGSLLSMGVLLLFDNPLGYGFGFNPSDHWQKVWQQLYTLENPSVLKDTKLHNYVLNMLNTYGIGLLILAPLVYHLLMRARHVMIFFVPYLVHIMFHNSGPFWNDVLFWFVVAALSAPVIQAGRTKDVAAPRFDRYRGNFGETAQR